VKRADGLQVKLDRENGLKKAALKRARDNGAALEKDSQFKRPARRAASCSASTRAPKLTGRSSPWCGTPTLRR
jgi:hypothetical protein